MTTWPHSTPAIKSRGRDPVSAPGPGPGQGTVGGGWDGVVMRTRDQGAATPEVLAAQFVGLLAAQDLDGIVDLYAADAVVSLPDGREAAGAVAIRRAFAGAVAAGTRLGAHAAIQPRVVVAGSLAMTSFTSEDGEVRTLVARREVDGTWLWVRDGSTLRHVTALAEGHSGAESRAVARVDVAVPA